MKKFILFFLLILSSITFSQSLQSLDKKNGFRHFKLGSNPSQIQNILLDPGTTDENSNIKVYTYVGTDIPTLAGVSVDNISLRFYKNKLYGIGVNFGNYEDKEFSHADFTILLQYLEKIYGGKWNLPLNRDGKTIEGAIWSGQKVKLELLRRGYGEKKSFTYDYVRGYIYLYDQALSKATYEDLF